MISLRKSMLLCSLYEFTLVAYKRPPDPLDEKSRCLGTRSACLLTTKSSYTVVSVSEWMVSKQTAAEACSTLQFSQ
eukprot:2623798-Amphidinium_carterae.1